MLAVGRWRTVLVIGALVAGACGGKSASPDPGPLAPVVSPSPSPSPSPTSVAHTLIISRADTGLSEEGRVEANHEGAVPVVYWLRDAFLGVAYPASSFPNAFATFTPGAAALAQQHGDVLTNASLGGQMDGLRATRYGLDYSLFARDGRPLGGTMAIDLEAVGRHATMGPLTLTITGSMQTMKTDAGWKVFSFDVTQQVQGDAVSPTVTTVTG